MNPHVRPQIKILPALITGRLVMLTQDIVLSKLALSVPTADLDCVILLMAFVSIVILRIFVTQASHANQLLLSAKQPNARL